ncbi:flavin reductase family protein [Arthrobacter sp. NPDC055138]
MTSTIDAQTFRQVLGSFLTGVTVITTVGPDGEYRGITANSFASVSLDPPLVLFCIGKQSSNCDAFEQSEGFNVHILSSDQQSLARQFVRGTPEEKFANVSVQETETGSPLLTDANSWLACRKHQVVDAGDHYIIIGEVYECDAQDARPLGFFQSQFQSFDLDSDFAQYNKRPGSPVTVAWILSGDDGRVALVKNQTGELELPKSSAGAARLSDEYLSGMAGGIIGASASIDFLFSLYEDLDGDVVLVYRGVLKGSVDGLADAIILADLDVLQNLPMAEKVERSMLNRYRRERVEARFGIYSGSHDEGRLMSVESL